MPEARQTSPRATQDTEPPRTLVQRQMAAARAAFRVIGVFVFGVTRPPSEILANEPARRRFGAD